MVCGNYKKGREEMKEYKVCVVGATGLVGQTFLKVLAEYDFPIQELKLLASARSKGKAVEFKGQTYYVEELTADSFDGFDLALFSAGGDVSKQFAPIARAKGLTVVDNSSAWRQDPAIPLVVPEVNLADTALNKLIANPNCSTIQSIIPLKALDDAFGVTKVNYATYQAVSGSGQKGKDDLARTLQGEEPQFYPHNIAETCIPEIDVFMEDGYTKEEVKMINETRKILHKPELPVSATCVRVPVANSHGVAMTVELAQDFTLPEVEAVLADFPGIILANNNQEHYYPTSTLSNGQDKIYVGRLRKDRATKNGLLLYCTGDNIRKGAAANAVQIALAMAKNNQL